mgnify:CR=1 FL=1
MSVSGRPHFGRRARLVTLDMVHTYFGCRTQSSVHKMGVCVSCLVNPVATAKAALVISNLIQLGLGFAFMSAALIAVSVISIVGVAATVCLDGLLQTLMYLLPLGSGVVVVIFYRTGNVAGILNLELDWFASIFFGWVNDLLRGMPEGIAYFNVFVSFVFLVVNAVMTFFGEEFSNDIRAAVMENVPILKMEPKSKSARPRHDMPLIAVRVSTPPPLAPRVREKQPWSAKCETTPSTPLQAPLTNL